MQKRLPRKGRYRKRRPLLMPEGRNLRAAAGEERWMEMDRSSIVSTRADMLAVAVSLFCERGYHGISMREIAQVLDIGETTLCTYFASKGELLWEIMARIARLFLTHARFVPDTIAHEEQLKLLIYHHLEVIALEPDYAMLFFRERESLEPGRKAEFFALCDKYEARFYQVILDGTRVGVFHVKDVPFAGQFVISALNGIYQACKPSDLRGVTQFANSYSDLILQALNFSPLKTVVSR